MSDAPFIKFYPSDFLAGTSGLSPAERGVYITLLCLIYEADGPIQRDDGRLARRCGTPKPTFVRILEGLISESKITEVCGALSNKRAEKALKDRQNRIEKSTHAAHSRWRSEGHKTQQKQCREDASALPEQSGAVCQPEPDIRKEEGDYVSCQTSPDPVPASEIAEAVSACNAAAETHGWPKVQKMTPTRTRAMRARCSEAGGVRGWVHAIEQAGASDFLSGRDGRWQGFAFDWLAKPSNFTKLMEGNYENRNHKRVNGFAGGHSRTSQPGQGTADAFAAVGARLQRQQGTG